MQPNSHCGQTNFVALETRKSNRIMAVEILSGLTHIKPRHFKLRHSLQEAHQLVIDTARNNARKPFFVNWAGPRFDELSKTSHYYRAQRFQKFTGQMLSTPDLLYFLLLI